MPHKEGLTARPPQAAALEIARGTHVDRLPAPRDEGRLAAHIHDTAIFLDTLADAATHLNAPKLATALRDARVALTQNAFLSAASLYAPREGAS